MGVTFTGGVTPPTELLLPMQLRATFAMINSHAHRAFRMVQNVPFEPRYGPSETTYSPPVHSELRTCGFQSNLELEGPRRRIQRTS